MSHSLLHKLAFGIWAMRPECVAAYEQQVRNVLSGVQPLSSTPDRQQKEQEKADLVNLYFVTPDGDILRPSYKEPVVPVDDMVAVFDVNGAIMQDDYCGMPGTYTMSNWLAEFEAAPQVSGVVLKMNSPGGDGYGMLTMARQMEKMTKPVVTLVHDGMAASAAYGIAASGKLVYSVGSMDEFGSIGTYVRLANWDKANLESKNWPLEIHTIYATKSTEKNKDFRTALEADPTNPDDPKYAAIRKNYIDPFNNTFLELIQRSRPGIKDERGTFKGRTYFAEEALELGLIDATGKTMTDAIEAARSLNQTNK